jgi:hypothetical protein
MMPVVATRDDLSDDMLLLMEDAGRGPPSWLGALEAMPPPAGDLEGLLAALSTLRAVREDQGCDTLQCLDVSGLPALERLQVVNCKKLRMVKGLRGTTALKGLEVERCGRLQEVEGLDGSWVG